MAVLGATGGASSSPTKSGWDSAENLIDGGDGVTIPPVVARFFFGQQKFAFDEVGKVDSAFCRIALLGFAIRINALVNVDEGKNQRD